MASANAPSLKGAHAQRGLCEPWESTTLIRTLPKRAKRQHSDTRENSSLCFQQFTPTPRKHGLAKYVPWMPSVSLSSQVNESAGGCCWEAAGEIRAKGTGRSTG